MNKSFKSKLILILFLTITIVTLLQVFSLATTSENIQNVQMIEKSENEYIIYIAEMKDNMLNEKFEFAFSNNKDENVENLTFIESALDKVENGNHIAYVDSSIYTQYFKDKEHTFIWVRQGTEYKIEAQEVDLSSALSEQEIKELNDVTNVIKVTIGEKTLPEETKNGVKVSHKIGTLIIDNQTENYSYKMVKVTEGTDTEKLVELANQLNAIEDKDMFTKLATYNEFKTIYNKLKPEIKDDKWEAVEDYTIEQPQNSKTGDQYLVWLKQENGSIIDVQIMTCIDEYTPEYETQERVIKETSKMPITGDNITLFIIAGILIVLIAIVVILKVRNNKTDKKIS